MFPVNSPTFSKLKCPRQTIDMSTVPPSTNCSFGENCCFSHDKSVYRESVKNSQIALSSLTYFKDLQERIRKENEDMKKSGLFSSEGDSKMEPEIEIDKNISTFLHKQPASCKISKSLREQILLKIVKSMRQIDATSTLIDAAQVEGELLIRSGGLIRSIYLSLVTDWLNKNKTEMKKDQECKEKKKFGLDADEEKVMEALKAMRASKKDLREFGYPVVLKNENMTLEDSDSVDVFNSSKECRRCGTVFIPSIYYSTYPNTSSPPCRYHERKLEKIGGLRIHTCCQAIAGDVNGCETHNWHVFEKYSYSSTATPPTFPRLNFRENGQVKEIVALDAEMIYTVGGYEVSRLTVIDFFSEDILMDVLVEPRESPVLDYNTKFSGVSGELYESGKMAVLSFADMKEMLCKFIGEETIIAGHSLENDFKVLEFSHEHIIDTVLLYPHKSRPPYRMSLKSLALGHLSELIQQSTSGHDSKEDCVTCVRLIKKYMEKHHF